MKTILSLVLATIAPFCHAESEPRTEAISPVYGHIDAEGLFALINSQIPFVILDGRGENWHDNNIILGALLAWYEDSEEDFAQIIPSKDSLVVVYCFSATCPLAPRLAARLLEFGYSHVIVYPEGLKEWRNVKHFPVELIQD